MDEWIFSLFEAINEKWTSHVASSEDEMKKQIVSQREELRSLSEIVEVLQESEVQRDQFIASQQEELRQLREIMLKILSMMQESNGSPRSVNGFQNEGDVNIQQIGTGQSIAVPHEAHESMLVLEPQTNYCCSSHPPSMT